MLPKTGLVIVSNPNQISKVFSSAKHRVKNTLYVQLLAALSEPLGAFYKCKLNSCPKFSQTIYKIYDQAAKHCNNLDVQVLISGLKYNVPKIVTSKPIDVLIFDKTYTKDDLDNFIKTRIENAANQYEIVTVDTEIVDDLIENPENDQSCNHSVLGGTFDRLHIAHKLLLSEAILRATNKMTVGITEENMIQGKLLWELIEDMNIRIKNVKNFLEEVCPELEYNIVGIEDPYGPAIVDPTMDVIVVSEETIRGGNKINELREEKGLKPLQVVPVRLIDEPNPSPIEESKISSSTTRLRLLGTLLKPVHENDNIPKIPYVIGLTGGIASGKSGVASHLEQIGAYIINCDKLAHDLYKPGMPCHKLITNHFGEEVLNDSGEINRQVLGSIVFKDPIQLQKLNGLVWPAMAEELLRIIRSTDQKVVIIEAAVLLTAGWQKYCHEVWTTIIPKQEAIQRLVHRNNLTEEEALRRMSAQPANSEFVRNANVVFCTLWPVEQTRLQVVKAWSLLQNRLLK